VARRFTDEERARGLAKIRERIRERHEQGQTWGRQADWDAIGDMTDWEAVWGWSPASCGRRVGPSRKS